MADIHCPECRQIDQVQKVSSIVTAGTSRSAASHPMFSSVSQTDLSAQLAAPGEPSYEDPISSGGAGCGIWIGISLLGGSITQAIEGCIGTFFGTFFCLRSLF